MAEILRGGGPVAREPGIAAAERPAEPDLPEDVLDAEVIELGTAAAPLPMTLPAGTALLRVTRQEFEGHECFHLELQTDAPLRTTVNAQDLRNQRRPGITLAGVAARENWRESLQAIRVWSVTKVALRQWLTALRQRHGRKLRLIIWDETDFQIPWELFFHETDEPDNHGWLGADIEIIRWTTVYSETPVDWSTGGTTVCRGPVLSFVGDGFPSLDRLLSRWPHIPASSLKELLLRLDDATHEVGLVHLWGHGIPGRNGELATLAGMSMDRLSTFRMATLRSSRALVLLNACGSGQLMNDDRFGETATRTFAEIFLRRGARGVIATSGQVGKTHSIDLLNHLLFTAERGAVSLSCALLDYRASLADELPPDPFDETVDEGVLKAFVYGSMYLYVGHLDTGLHMQPLEGAE